MVRSKRDFLYNLGVLFKRLIAIAGKNKSKDVQKSPVTEPRRHKSKGVIYNINQTYHQQRKVSYGGIL